MTAKRKRLKKLMQSIGIQRNDFENNLTVIRNMSESDFKNLIKTVRFQGKWCVSVGCIKMGKFTDENSNICYGISAPQIIGKSISEEDFNIEN